MSHIRTVSILCEYLKLKYKKQYKALTLYENVYTQL